MARKQDANTAIDASRHGQTSGDRFENVVRNGRVGAHRMVGRPRRFWIYLVSALAATALLTGVGIVAVQFTGANVNDWLSEVDEQAPPPPPSVDPEIDPDAQIAVLNGTGMPGFGAIVDSIITENEWGEILFSGDAATSDVEISAVFYGSVADEAIALGLAQELGGVSIYQSYEYLQEYGVQLVVLLGSDYGGPGSDRLVPVENTDGAAADTEGETEGLAEEE